MVLSLMMVSARSCQPSPIWVLPRSMCPATGGILPQGDPWLNIHTSGINHAHPLSIHWRLIRSRIQVSACASAPV